MPDLRDTRPDKEKHVDTNNIISGTAPVGGYTYLYEIYDGRPVRLCAIFPDPTGHWQLTLNPSLASGTHHLYVASGDTVLEQFDVINGVQMPSDTALPPVPIEPTRPNENYPLTLGGLIDHGGNHPPVDVPYGGNSDSTQPLFYGTATPGALVQLYEQHTHAYVGAVRADENGYWEFQVENPLLAGPNHPHAVYAQALGQVTEPFNFWVQTDNTAPVDPVQPVDPTDPTHPVDPVDPTHPVDPVSPVDPTDPPVVDPVPPPVEHTLTIQGVISENFGEPAFEVGDGGTSNSAFPTLYGTAIPNVGITIYDAVTGRFVDATRSDDTGHWQTKVELSLRNGPHELYAVSVAGDRSELFHFTVDTSYHPSNPPQLQDVLADDSHALFAQDAEPAQPQHAQAHAKLDTHDLSYAQPGGVHAEVAAHAAHALGQHEEVHQA
jgi:hypothetical protein